MAKLRRSRVKRRLVLDIGSRAVRLCELSQTKTGLQLTKYYQREFPVEPGMEEEEKRRVRSEVVKQLLKDSKVRYKKTVFGLPGQSIFNRCRALPPVPEHKVTQIVRYEIQQQIPFALDQIAFDYQVLQRTEAGGYDVLMAAIKVDVVEKNLAILQDIKRQIDIVDVCPLAAYNWLKYTGEFGDEGECVAFIDLGASTTDIVIERGNQFRFARPLSIGGDAITESVAKAFGMSFAEAERLKRERGFAPTGDPRRDGKGGEVIGQALSRLISEITRTFAYFRSQPGGGPVSRVVVAGGGACLRNIVPYLQRELGLEVRIAQPLSGLAIGPGAQEVNENPEQACVALGLALRCCQTVPIEINLIPPRITEGARRREQIFYWLLSAVTLVLILASIIPANAHKHELVRKQIEDVNRYIGMYDAALALSDDVDPAVERKSRYEKDLEDVKLNVKALEGEIVLLDKAYKGRADWVKYLVEIGGARPKGKGVWLSAVESCEIRPKPPESEGEGSSRRGGLSESESMSSGSTGRGESLPVLVSGFSGVGTSGSAASSEAFGRDGGGFGGRQESSAAAAPPASARSGGETAAPSVQPKAPNGLSIIGYASDPEAVWQYVENLKKVESFSEGVYFDESTANRVPPSVLNSANVGFGVSSGAQEPVGRGGFGSTSRDSMPDSFPSPTTSAEALTPNAAGALNTLTSFVIHVQYAKSIEPEQAPAASAEPATGLMPGAPDEQGESPQARRSLRDEDDEEDTLP